ncbi:MAG: hypothetical protein ACK53Y_15275 [bacterium]
MWALWVGRAARLPPVPSGGGPGGEWLVLVRSLSPALGHKVLFAHALSSWSGWVDPGIPLLLPTGPRSSSLMTSWVPGSLASCCLFLAVVLGRCNRQGPITKSPSEGETVGLDILSTLIYMTRRGRSWNSPAVANGP